MKHDLSEMYRCDYCPKRRLARYLLVRYAEGGADDPNGGWYAPLPREALSLCKACVKKLAKSFMLMARLPNREIRQVVFEPESLERFKADLAIDILPGSVPHSIGTHRTEHLEFIELTPQLRAHVKGRAREVVARDGTICGDVLARIASVFIGHEDHWARIEEAERSSRRRTPRRTRRTARGGRRGRPSPVDRGAAGSRASKASAHRTRTRRIR